MTIRAAIIVLTSATAVAAAGLCGGCQLPSIIGNMAQNAEYQKLIEVRAKYTGLSGKTVAVLVDADLETRYEYPYLANTVAEFVTVRIGRDVPGVRVLPPAAAQEWQFRTPQWNSLPYGVMADQLGVDRIVYVDIYEYRLNPPGNRYEWDGVAAANVSIIERDALDPDTFADSFNVASKYPDKSGYGPESADRAVIQSVLLNKFVIQTAWLFFDHEEPKYPDKYRPEPK